MSYSINVQGKTADEVREELDSKLAEIIERQPIHARDRDAAVKAVKALLSVVEVPEGKMYKVSVSGSCGWDGNLPADGDHSNVTITGVGVNVSVSLADAPKEEAA